MEHERRRDRVWKQIINCVYRNGEVRIDDIDVSLTYSADDEEDVDAILNKYNLDRDDLDADNLTKRPDGTTEIEISPDASKTTKRSVLNTMSKDRFGFLEKPDAPKGVWYPGPYLKALFCLDHGDANEDNGELRHELIDDVLSNDEFSEEEKTRSLKMIQS